MIGPLRYFRRRILVDVDTQRDFFLVDGHACIRNHRRVLTNIRRVMAWARANNIHVISTAQVHSKNNGTPKVGYCTEGTDGGKKLNYTLRNRKICFEADGCTDLPRDLFLNYDQIILNKRCTDPFNEPRAERLLTEIRASEFIIIGAITENAVKSTVLGLLQRKKKVTVLTDAVGSGDKEKAQLAIRKMQAKGAKLSDTKSLAGISSLHVVGACNCQRCNPKKMPLKIGVTS